MLAYYAIKQGNLLRISCSDNRAIETDNWFDMVTFLLEPTDMAVVYHLDKFTDAVLSICPPDIVQEVRDKGKAFLPQHEKLYYQPGRVFAITYAGKEVNFYGLSRYTDNDIEDLNELLELTNDVIEAYKHFGITPTKLTSPVGVYVDILDKVDFPRACDLPESSYELISKAAEVMWREWREVYKLGHWDKDEITDYDIVSGYPSLIAKLPDLRDAEFFTSDVLPDKYSWGLISGTLNITKDVSPFPVGKYTDMITTDQLWLLRRYGIGDIDIEQGWYFNLPRSYALPFEKIMARLYHARDSDNELVSRISKGISVGIGGKFAQRYDDGRLGDCFNSIYALMITTRCSTKVADFIYRNLFQDSVVSVLVDGVLIEGSHTPMQGKSMGSWRSNPPSPYLVLSLLYQWGNDKKPGGLSYDDMMALIKAEPNSSVYNDIDFNLLEYDRVFPKLPQTGKDLLSGKFPSEPSVS